eukprot:6471772-Amphidinium_carterae.1
MSHRCKGPEAAVRYISTVPILEVQSQQLGSLEDGHDFRSGNAAGASTVASKASILRSCMLANR